MSAVPLDYSFTICLTGWNVSPFLIEGTISPICGIHTNVCWWCPTLFSGLQFILRLTPQLVSVIYTIQDHVGQVSFLAGLTGFVLQIGYNLNFLTATEPLHFVATHLSSLPPGPFPLYTREFPPPGNVPPSLFISHSFFQTAWTPAGF